MKYQRMMLCFILLFCIKGLALSNYAVLVEESPVGAGEIKPGIGVLTFNPNETVTLTTVARAGWCFVYWLGDVSDPKANQTMLAVDGPNYGDRGLYKLQEKINTTNIEGLVPGILNVKKVEPCYCLQGRR